MPRAKPDHGPWRRGFGWLVRFVAGAFVGIHVYAFALKFLPVPGTLNIALQAVQGETIKRDMVSLDNISPHLVRAVIAAEDARYCEHEGIDREAIEKAIEEYRAGEGLRGGSTITQQTAKNVFFWNGGGFVRKAGEAWMATFVDFVWGKRRTMEIYLNVAEWGDGIFGAEAAAQERFGKSAADLSEREAALLAAVLPSPNKWRVDPPGPYVRKRAGTIQARMRVVRSQGLAACAVSGEAASPEPAPRPKPKTDLQPQTPQPTPDVAPPLPPRDDGPIVSDTTPSDDLQAVIDAGDSVFNAPDEAAIDESAPIIEPQPVPAPSPTIEPDPETPAERQGPKSLIPSPADEE